MSNLTEQEKHQHHIEGGYKATLSNEKASEEAKKHAQEQLDKIARGEKVEATSVDTSKYTEEEKHQHHIEGGFKATLSNEKSSEEAKKYAQEQLDRLSRGEKISESEHKRYQSMSEDEKHRHHVEGGFKATLANEKSSEEAKKHAQEQLDKIAKGEEPERAQGLKRSADDLESSESGKGKQGFASMPKEKVQEIDSKGGRTQHAGEEPSSKKSKTEESDKSESKSDNKTDTANMSEEEKHRHHVMGGYKATLNNANASEEAKILAQQKLHEMMDGESDSKSESKSDSKSESESSESGKGKQGFASMPKEKVQEIASKGGRTQHAGEEAAPKKSESESDDKSHDSDKSETGKGKQGFASMPKEKVQEIASKGGRTQHAGEEAAPKKSESESDDKSNDDKTDTGKGKQGFASMPKEKVQEIASKGGRTKNAGEEPTAVKNQ